MFHSVVRRTIPAMRNVRTMAHDAKAEASRWKQLSFIMIGVSGLVGVANMLGHHEHDNARHDLPYMHIRSKPYPFECDCSLFDKPCWKECREQ